MARRARGMFSRQREQSLLGRTRLGAVADPITGMAILQTPTPTPSASPSYSGIATGVDSVSGDIADSLSVAASAGVGMYKPTGDSYGELDRGGYEGPMLQVGPGVETPDIGPQVSIPGASTSDVETDSVPGVEESSGSDMTFTEVEDPLPSALKPTIPTWALVLGAAGAVGLIVALAKR